MFNLLSNLKISGNSFHEMTEKRCLGNLWGNIKRKTKTPSMSLLQIGQSDMFLWHDTSPCYLVQRQIPVEPLTNSPQQGFGYDYCKVGFHREGSCAISHICRILTIACSVVYSYHVMAQLMPWLSKLDGSQSILIFFPIYSLMNQNASDGLVDSFILFCDFQAV